MADAPGAEIEIDVVYLSPAEQVVVTLRVQSGFTAGQAVERSGILSRFLELNASIPTIGIYGQRVASSTIVRAFDRVEIYRALIADPKQARRTRARRAGK